MAIIEHITYPRDLRFSAIVSFKSTLSQKIKSTYIAGQDPSHSVFLKNFGTFHVSKLNDEALSADRAVLAMLKDLQGDIGSLRRSVSGLHEQTSYRLIGNKKIIARKSDRYKAGVSTIKDLIEKGIIDKESVSKATL